jgi:hypothetical protein
MEDSRGMMLVDACITEVLKHGLDDWIQAAEVASVVQSIQGGTSDADICDVALVVIAEILRGELMKAGDVTLDGFKEWSMTSTEALDRIAREWKALGRSPNLGEICWLSNTSEGDRRAQSSN